LGAGNSKYCLGENARNTTLGGTYNWYITDGGKNCSPEDDVEDTAAPVMQYLLWGSVNYYYIGSGPWIDQGALWTDDVDGA